MRTNSVAKWFPGLVAVVLVGVAFGQPAQAEEKEKTSKPKIAVQQFTAKGVEATIASTLETSFCNELAEYGDVLCSGDVKSIMQYKQLELGVGACDNEDACLAQMAEAVQAEKVVTGEVAKLGTLFIINVTLVDPQSKKVLARASEKTEKVEDLLGKLAALAKKVSGK